MALTTTDFNVSFLLGGSSKVFKFTDVTDYTSQGESLNDVTGRIKITAPSGVVYNNLGGSADITGSTSRINTTSIQVPLLSDGTPEVGLYTFEYQSTIGAVVVSKIKTFSYSYKKPTPSNQVTVDCLTPELSGSDTTNYLVNSLTPFDRFSITSVSAANNTISIAGEKVGFVAVGDTFSVTGSSAINGDYTVTGVDYKFSSTENNTVITVASITSASTGGLVVTRKTTLFYPSVLQLPPLVGTQKTLDTSTFYSQTNEFLFKTKGYYEYTNGISISDSFSSSKEIDVDCDIRLCDIFCCINSLFNDYIKYKEANNTTLAAIELERYVLATSHLASLRTAFECGDTAAVDNLVTQIKKVAQCNSDCSCSDGTPSIIGGLSGGGGSSSTSVVTSGGNGIDVSSSVSGSVTDFSLTLNSSVVSDIQSGLATSSVSSLSGSGISVTPSSSGANTEYSLALSSTPVSPKETMVMKLESVSQGFNQPRVFTPKDVTIQNPTNLRQPLFFTEVPVSSNWDLYTLRVSGFQLTPNSTYKVDISSYFQEYKANSVQVVNSSEIGYEAYYLDVKVVKLESDSFDLVFVTKDGDYVTPGAVGLNKYDKIYLNIKIYE
tara:strand:- start:24405 stop:26222 length:1818 start_codon:yes stop_codon:yes gene_type:complete